MPSDPQHHHRRSIRLPGYDYAQTGAYFITVCTHARQPILGKIADGVMYPNRLGIIVWACWRDLPRHYPHVVLDAFVVMPNHVHGIIVLVWVGAGSLAGVDGRPGMGCGTAAGCASADADKPAPTTTTDRHPLGEVVRAFKTYSARGINRTRGTPDQPVWQRNYYEHIIRDDAELTRIREYIESNPLAWDLDEENLTHPIGDR